MPEQKEYYKADFINHENQFQRNPLERESEMYVAVSEGNTAIVNELCTARIFTHTEGLGVLSDDSIQNIRYHFVIGTAMITRFCVKKGLVQDAAYGMSDYYIKQMDFLSKIEDIESLYYTMCCDFCNTMAKKEKQSVISKSIVLTLDYIHTNIHSTITLPMLAKNVGLSESYLSRLFNKEMGLPLHEYINKAKIEKAKNLLCYSNYSVIDIANYLAFSSHSHFISVFKKSEGITPTKYRNSHFRDNWSTISRS